MKLLDRCVYVCVCGGGGGVGGGVGGLLTFVIDQPSSPLVLSPVAA